MSGAAAACTVVVSKKCQVDACSAAIASRIYIHTLLHDKHIHHPPHNTQLAQAVQEARASSILATGSVELAHVGGYLRSRHGYLVCLRRANVCRRPKAYLRMLRHNYLVVRGLEGLEGERVRAHAA